MPEVKPAGRDFMCLDLKSGKLASMLDPPPGVVWLTPELLQEFIEVAHVRTAPNMRFHAMYKTLCGTFDEDGSVSFRAHVMEPTVTFIHQERGEDGYYKDSAEEEEEQRQQDEQDVNDYMMSEYIFYGLPKGVEDLGVEDSVKNKWDPILATGVGPASEHVVRSDADSFAYYKSACMRP